MKDIQTHKRNQNFVLFWLGLLTGALLIVALYSVGSSEDLLGKVRGRTYQVPTYAAPSYSVQQPNYSQPSFTPPSVVVPIQYGGYSVPASGYEAPTGDGYGYNSVLHAVPSTSASSLRSRVIAPSVNRSGVYTPNYGTASLYSPVNGYEAPTSDGYSAY